MRALGLMLVLGVGCTRVTLEPARYTCSQTATAEQCPGGWRCLPEGFCVDPAQGGPWACAVSADCTGAWHCGPEGRCYERATATNVACRREPDATEGSDCADGWTCGLDLRCLDTRRANGNRCEVDLDCFAGQRCAASRCVDATADALRPGTTQPTLVGDERPFLGASVVTAHQTASDRRIVAAFNGGRLWWLDIAPSPDLDGGAPLHSLVWNAPLPTELAVAQDTSGFSLVMLQADGGVDVFSLETQTVRPLSLPFAATGVRATGDDDLALAVLGNTGLAVGKLNSLQVELGLDAGVVRDLFVDPLDGLILSTSRGGWTRSYVKTGFPTDGWVPALCDFGGQPLPELQLVRTVVLNTGKQLLAVTSDGGTTSVHRFVQSVNVPTGCATVAGSVVYTADARAESLALAHPRALLTDQNLLAAAGFSANNTPSVVWLDGGTTFDALSVTNLKQLTVLDAAGRVRLQSAQLPALIPLMPSSAPVATFGRELMISRQALPKDTAALNTPLGGDTTCFSRRSGSWCQAANVLSSTWTSTRGAESWLAHASNDPNPLYPAAVFDFAGATTLMSQSFTAAPPLYLSAARSRGSETVIVTAGFDYLSWADVKPGEPGVARVAVSPLPRGDLTDLLLTNRAPSSTEASFAEGWVIASGRVFRVFASTRALWRSSEVLLPTEVETLRLWLDDTRPRAGDRNGVVFSLDSAVALSGPLPPGELAVQYANECNNDFVLSDQKRLYRLVAGPGTLAQWEWVPTSGPIERLSDVAPLRAFDAEGRTWWLEGLTCTP